MLVLTRAAYQQLAEEAPAVVEGIVNIRGQVVPVVQSPFWREQRTMLVDEAPRLERAVFSRWFEGRL